MAFSNTVSLTTFNTDKVLRSAVRRTKVPAEQLSSEDWAIAQDELYLFLSALANQGVPLWCITKIILPLYEGVGAVTMPLGVVDTLNQNFRKLQAVTGTDTDTSTAHTVEFDTSTFVTTVGILWSATSVAVAFERSDDGVVWETVQTETPQAVTGEWTWYDLQSSIATDYFRVRATTGTLGFSQIYLGNNPTEIPLARLNQDDYTNLPNKMFQSSQPLQFWFDRTVRYPVMNMWPVPNAAASVCQIVAWVHRQIMDVGTLTQEIEVPQRWYDVVVSGLAARLARELTQVDAAIIPQLDSDAAIAANAAWGEERDNSPTKWAPDISPYTR